MINKKIKILAKDYFVLEYLKETNNMFKMKKFKCANCHKMFKVSYDKNNVPLSLWCDRCRSLENKIKEKFKMKNSSKNPKNSKDPYIALAQMKVLLERAEKYWKKEFPIANIKDEPSILSEISDILQNAKIPDKYLIAESLD